MRKQIIINSAKSEVRVALLENGALAEVHIERSGNEASAGNIYLGKVLRVLPGMQAAFVDIGLEKAAFLHSSDIVDFSSDRSNDEDVQYDEPHGKRNDSPIENKIRKGDELVVQIAKEPLGTKGARITSHVSIPGRYIVYMPTGHQIGVSKRIGDDRERRRLRELVASAKTAEGGVIVRTSCQGLPPGEVQGDVHGVEKTWKTVLAKAKTAHAPCLLQSELDLVLRSVRDLLSSDVDEILVDSEHDWRRVKDYVRDFMPQLAERVEPYKNLVPIFDRYGVEDQIGRAIQAKVWLKSGGYLVIDQGEALTMIDVNTGRFVGKRSQEDTVFRTNIEATEEVVSQLRLRNIGGIIIIDFIDMEEASNRRAVTDALEKALTRDKARTTILRISELGLVEMTRKRTRENLGRLLSSPCPYCDGRGRIKSVPTVAYEILRCIQKEAAVSKKRQGRVAVRASRDVIMYLYNDEEEAIRALQERLGRNVTLRVAETYHQEQYDVVAT